MCGIQSVKPAIFSYIADSVPSRKWQDRTINGAALSSGLCSLGFKEASAYSTSSNSADMTPDAHAPPKERKALPLNTKIICRKAIWSESIPLGLKKMK